MKKHDRLDALDRRPPAGRNLLLLGFWMRSTIAGAAFAGAGFATLIDPPQGVPFLTPFEVELATPMPPRNGCRFAVGHETCTALFGSALAVTFAPANPVWSAGCVEDFHLQVRAPCRAHQQQAPP